MHKHSSRPIYAIAAGAIAALTALSFSANADDDDIWPSLQKEVYGTRSIIENDGAVLIDAPERAEDPAVVPITIRVPPSVKGPLKSMALIIDKNPAPIAANITFGPAAGDGGGERRMTTRVRIDTYSYVRAVIETEDGALHMVKTFVKASGGCSAPAPKDADGETADLGRMQVRSFDPALASTPLREALIMIKHPNTNGMQMDPISRGYIPARFIKSIEVKRGDDLVFRAKTGISIAASPHFRFTYANGSDNALSVKAIDTEPTTFTGGNGAGSQAAAVSQ